jgi:hypothetical protein
MCARRPYQTATGRAEQPLLVTSPGLALVRNRPSADVAINQLGVLIGRIENYSDLTVSSFAVISLVASWRPTGTSWRTTPRLERWRRVRPACTHMSTTWCGCAGCRRAGRVLHPVAVCVAVDSSVDQAQLGAMVDRFGYKSGGGISAGLACPSARNVSAGPAHPPGRAALLAGRSRGGDAPARSPLAWASLPLLCGSCRTTGTPPGSVRTFGPHLP